MISKQWNYIKYHCFRWTLYPPDYATFSKQVNDEASQIWCTFLLKGPAKSLVLCSEEKTVFYKYLYWEVHKVSWKQDKQFGERQYQGNNKLKLKLKLKLKCNTQMCTLFTTYSPYMRRGLNPFVSICVEQFRWNKERISAVQTCCKIFP